MARIVFDSLLGVSQLQCLLIISTLVMSRQDRYGLLSSAPNSLPNPILALKFYPSCIQAIPMEQENHLVARVQGV